MVLWAGCRLSRPRALLVDVRLAVGVFSAETTNAKSSHRQSELSRCCYTLGPPFRISKISSRIFNLG